MKALGMILLAGIATCQNVTNIGPSKMDSGEWKSVKISINETAVEGFYNDAMKFGKLWLDTTQNERENVRKALADAYENAAARMIMNFGKTVVPLVSSWANLTQKLQVNADCNQDCAVKCFDVKQGHDALYFEAKCMSACGCSFDLLNMPAGYHQAADENLMEQLMDLEEYGKSFGQNFSMAMKPSVDAYLMKAKTLHDEFGLLVKEHAVQDLGCDPQCVADCTNKDYISFFEVPDCLRWCKCEQNVLKIDDGSLNYASLIQFNGYDTKTWKFFKDYDKKYVADEHSQCSVEKNCECFQEKESESFQEKESDSFQEKESESFQEKESDSLKEEVCQSCQKDDKSCKDKCSKGKGKCSKDKGCKCIKSEKKCGCPLKKL